MKRSLYLWVIALFFICSAQTCQKGGNDLLANLYGKAYTSKLPLKATAEPVYPAILGAWDLMGDRPLVISKKAADTYEFKFMSPYLSSDDIVYDAQVNTIGGVKYISMKGYNDDYMFFRFKDVNKEGMTMLMLTSGVAPELNEKSLTQYLAAHPSAPDTSLVWYNIPLRRLTEDQAIEMQQKKLSASVYSIDDYETYASRFPTAPGLVEMKKKTMAYSIENASSMEYLTNLSRKYPEAADQIKAGAKKHCKNTGWCIDYLKSYPNDPAKDSVLNLAFDRADSHDDYVKLLENYPAHAKAGRITLSMALEESRNLKDDKDQERLEQKYAQLPSVIQLVNTIRIFNNFQLGETSFQKNSYLLTQKGKDDLDKVASIITGLNKNTQMISDVYVSVSTSYDYGLGSEKANFLQSANKALIIKRYLESKGVAGLNVHCIPLGQANSGMTLANENTRFTLDDKLAAEWKTKFFSTCYAIQQSDVIPDVNRELSMSNIVRVPEIEDYILHQFEKQAALYKSKQAYERVIPSNYFLADGKTTQPGFEEFNARLLVAAKASKVKKKNIPLFVVGM